MSIVQYCGTYTAKFVMLTYKWMHVSCVHIKWTMQRSMQLLCFSSSFPVSSVILYFSYLRDTHINIYSRFRCLIIRIRFSVLESDERSTDSSYEKVNLHPSEVLSWWGNMRPLNYMKGNRVNRDWSRSRTRVGYTRTGTGISDTSGFWKNGSITMMMIMMSDEGSQHEALLHQPSWFFPYSPWTSRTVGSTLTLKLYLPWAHIEPYSQNIILVLIICKFKCLYRRSRS
jgi:hypothetical protein